MKLLNEKLKQLATKIKKHEPIKVAIIGLGSVGSYLLDYLLDWNENDIEIHIAVRNLEKAQSDVNIARVAKIIRDNSIKKITLHVVDLETVESIQTFFAKVQPDFTVNSSRVYSGLKYGSISWKTIRAYGLWIPLSVKFIRNIMIAYQNAQSQGIIINTSYSDGTNPWLKSAGLAYPDFGSGNLNHLIPRIKLAVQKKYSLKNLEDIEVLMSTSHFHDVLISKEGKTEGIEPLIHITYQGQPLDVAMQDIYAQCTIAMPTNEKRNMMNASSNFEIIKKLVRAAKEGTREIIHSPGVDGNLGGYPVRVDFAQSDPLSFAEDFFSFQEMVDHNRKSLALDGIGSIDKGVMTYTSKLVTDVREKLNTVIPLSIHIEEAARVANLIIERIIKKQVS